MTLGDQITYSERRARTDSNALTLTTSDDVTVQYINEGVREFAKQTNGIPKEGYLAVSPAFDLETNFAVRLTITSGANALAATDVALAATSHTDMGGASVATYISEQFSNTLALSLTLSWHSASWLFALHDGATACSYIEVEEPTGISYVDYTSYLFGKSGTQAGTTWTGQIPLDSTVETPLPDDFLEIERVEWDGQKLEVAPWDLFMSPGYEGSPRYYGIKNKRLRLNPYPVEQKLLHIWYKHMPDDLEATATSTDCPLPTECHMAPVYYAAAQIAMENEDQTVYQREMAMFSQQITGYKNREANNSPTLFPTQSHYTPIKVIIPSG